MDLFKILQTNCNFVAFIGLLFHWMLYFHIYVYFPPKIRAVFLSNHKSPSLPPALQTGGHWGTDDSSAPWAWMSSLIKVSSLMGMVLTCICHLDVPDVTLEAMPCLLTLKIVK